MRRDYRTEMNRPTIKMSWALCQYSRNVFKIKLTAIKLTYGCQSSRQILQLTWNQKWHAEIHWRYTQLTLLLTSATSFEAVTWSDVILVVNVLVSVIVPQILVNNNMSRGKLQDLHHHTEKYYQHYEIKITTFRTKSLSVKKILCLTSDLPMEAMFLRKCLSFSQYHFLSYYLHISYKINFCTTKFNIRGS